MYTGAKEKRDDVKEGDFVFELRKKKWKSFGHVETERSKKFLSLSLFLHVTMVCACVVAWTSDEYLRA